MDARYSPALIPTFGSALTCILAAGLVATACSRPNYEGPQVQEPPIGFRLDINSTQSREVFPGRKHRSQVAWWQIDSDADEHTSIFVTGYPGPSSREDISNARNEQENQYGSERQVYSALETIPVDERTAFAWSETQFNRDGDVVAVAYKAVVSYDDATYTIEFFSDEAEWLNVSSQREVVKTFAIGETRILPIAWVIALMVGAIVFTFVRNTFRRAEAADVERQTRMSQQIERSKTEQKEKREAQRKRLTEERQPPPSIE